MPSKRARPSRSPSAAAAAVATTSATDQRLATIRTARLLCRFAALACLAQALWGEDGSPAAAAAAALQAADFAAVAEMHATRVSFILVLGELTGWWMPTRLVGLQNFRNSPIFELLFHSAMAKKLVWRVAYWVMSYFYTCDPSASSSCSCLLPAGALPARAGAHPAAAAAVAALQQ